MLGTSVPHWPNCVVCLHFCGSLCKLHIKETGHQALMIHDWECRWRRCRTVDKLPKKGEYCGWIVCGAYGTHIIN